MHAREIGETCERVVITISFEAYEPRHEYTCFSHLKTKVQISNRAADQRFCFRYTDSTIPILPESEI